MEAYWQNKYVDSCKDSLKVTPSTDLSREVLGQLAVQINGNLRKNEERGEKNQLPYSWRITFLLTLTDYCPAKVTKLYWKHSLT